MKTPLQANYPAPKDFVKLANRWQKDAITNMMGFVWAGIDRLREEGFALASVSINIERGITQQLTQRIRDAMGESNGWLPYYLEHHPFENEMIKSPKASPKAPDLGFVWRANPRAMLPLEAKQLKTDAAVTDYTKEVTENFINCRYAPFSSEGGMLGYLQAGLPSVAIENIGISLRCQLKQHPAFSNRDHSCSTHTRNVEKGKSYPKKFKCHHLIFVLERH